MNLLIDDWIPVQHQGVFEQVSLKTLLTRDEPWDISLPRDDMEMACLQLLVSLTQVLFVPRDISELKARIDKPITEDEYIAVVKGKIEWFDMEHPEHPFMQYRGVEASAINPIMKLFAGFTESTSGAFVNEPGLADSVCPSCAAIGLFNQANSCASFCGGAKGSIRGNEKDGELKSGVPVTTLMSGNALRETIWLNVLTKETIEKYIGHEDGLNESPNWVDVIPTTGVSKTKIKQGKDVQLNQLGLLRGLFWQPQHIELVESLNPGACDSCGILSLVRYEGFRFEKFSYKYRGFWRHPHSPLQWTVSSGEKRMGYRSFTSDVPVWTHLVGMVEEKEADREGYSPAVVVSQFARYFFDSHNSNLLVGGYWAKPGKASINERLHELFSFSGGLSDNKQWIVKVVNAGLSYKYELNNHLYTIVKEISKTKQIPKPLQRMANGMQSKAIRLFFSETMLLVHEMLQERGFRENKAAFANFHHQLYEITLNIFNKVTKPYQNEPKMIQALAVARRGLEKSLADLN